MTRAVSVLEVADPGLWAELALRAPGLEGHLEARLDARRAIARATFEGEVLPALARQGLTVLRRHARRDATEVAAAREDLQDRVAALRPDTRRVLHDASRHALDGVVLGAHAWDPEADAAAVRTLVGAGLLLPDDDAPLTGRYRLHPDLPPPPAVPYDLAEAAMDETDDLAPARPGPVPLLHDLAALAAALHRVTPRRTVSGELARADVKRLGRLLGAPTLQAGAALEQDPRWATPLRALEALGAVSMDPVTRELFLDLHLEDTLAGDTRDAVDRLVHRLVERDLHVLLPAIREAIRQAGEGAVDAVVFLELLRTQHRDVLFPAWRRDGARVYPHGAGAPARPYDDAGFEVVEARLVEAVLRRLERLGVVRRAPGVFSGTPDGRLWAGATDRPCPPVWVTSDLEIVVGPESVTPWERFQLERLGRCLGRDVVTRYRLEREAWVHWLTAHDLDEALDLLRRRCPAVPTTVVDTLTSWTRDATRVVLTRGVLLPG